ncbi:MAG TPA: hypothetical protein VEQ17_10845 [Steroidobacteraceae bacterium]|nr:hypothetical protein [Steroidobacteraceae bacterium]
MIRQTMLIGIAVLLTGCGLAETGAVATAGGASAAEQAKQARATEDRVRQQLEEAQKVRDESLKDAEKAAE